MGVDFMAESVRATLDSNNLKHVPVYRLAEQKIGCSLAEAAERQAYGAFLHQAAQVERSLHVVYINTSLVTKAKAQETVRDIVCKRCSVNSSDG
jgi:quinolinate synthase